MADAGKLFVTVRLTDDVRRAIKAMERRIKKALDDALADESRNRKTKRSRKGAR